LYVELQRHHLRSEEATNQTLLGLAHKLHLPYFASNGVYYADQHDRELFDVFTCIKNHTTIYDAGKLLSENSERYLKSHRQMLALFEDYPEAVEITNEIASRVNFSMDELLTISQNIPYRGRNGEFRASRQGDRKSTQTLSQQGVADTFTGDTASGKRISHYRDEKIGRIFPYGLRHLGFLQREQHPFARPRLGGKFGSLLRSGHHSSRSDPTQVAFERFLSEKYEQYPDIDIDLPRATIAKR
jgi:error-prone DNA polymerase